MTEDLEKLSQEELEKIFKSRLREVNAKTSRIPGYAEIILKIMAQTLIDRISLLELLLNWLEKYSEMEFTGLEVTEKTYHVTEIDGKKVPFTKRYNLKVKYQCQDCKKMTEGESIPLMPNDSFRFDMALEKGNEKEPHLICKDCFFRNYYEPDYEHEEPDYEKDIEQIEDIKDGPVLPLIQPKKKL